MKLVIISALFLAGVFALRPQYNTNLQEDSAKDYMFKYLVKEEPLGNNFCHREMKIGNRVTGLYYVLLPDGRIQKVTYIADENGYQPTVTYLNP